MYFTVLSNNPHLVSLLFAIMLSLHCVTFCNIYNDILFNDVGLLALS